MLPWFIIAAMGGLVFGLLLGILLASTLVRGHYTHIMTNQQMRPQPAPRPHSGREYDEGYY